MRTYLTVRLSSFRLLSLSLSVSLSIYVLDISVLWVYVYFIHAQKDKFCHVRQDFQEDEVWIMLKNFIIIGYF